MKTISIFITITLLLSACTNTKTEVDSSASSKEARPSEGSQTGTTLEEEIPSFIIE